MDFTINKDDLLAAIDKCSVAVPDPKHPTEAFRIMLVDATKKKSVRFAAVGEFCSVDTVAEGQIKTSGSFHVKPKHLRDVSASMPPGQVHFSMKDSRITVKSVGSKRKASFTNHTVEIRTVEDPGKGAAWKTVDAAELLRGLRIAKAASTWYGNDDPVASLLIPTERGLDIFGCNMYLLADVQTSIQIDGDPIIFPATLSALLTQMAPTDKEVNIFVDQNRVYMENGDTLVSAQLFNYKFLVSDNYKFFLSMMKSPQNTIGPTVSLSQLTQGTKSVLSGTSSFLVDDEKRSEQLRLSFGDSVVIAVDLANVDAKDEFQAITPGADIDCYISSRMFEQMLASFIGVQEVQVQLAVYESTVMLVLHCEGITYGLMTKEKR